MHPRLLDPYQHGTSPVHRLPAIAKVLGAVVFVFTVVLLPGTAWLAFAACAAGLLLITLVSRLSPVDLAKKMLLLEPFVLGVAVLALFQQNGLSIFLVMLTRSTLCLFCMVLLSSTTRFSDILRVLWRLRVPSLLVTSLALMHRYLFLLVDETSRMNRARRSRNFSNGRLLAWRSSSTVIAQLFLRTSERAERIYAAMCARGWKP